MLLGEVVDQLLDQHRLAHAGPTEQAGLAALGVRGEQVDDLDARLEHLGGGGQVICARRLLVDASALDVGGQILTEVDRLAEQVEYAPERGLADGDGDGSTRVDHLQAARQPVGGVHRDRAHTVVAEVLLDLAHEHALAGHGADPGRLLRGGRRRPGDRDRVIDLGQALGKDGLDHYALDLLDAPDIALGDGAGGGLWGRRLGGGGVHCLDSPRYLHLKSWSGLSALLRGPPQLRPSAPATTSMISWVISAWRARFICSVKSVMISPAFSEALRIAVIWAPKKPAADSTSAR